MLIWPALAALALAVLAPLLLALRARGRTRGGRELAMALHRAQLAELERDRAQGRLLPEDYATAVLEVQRRLLAAAAAAEPPPRPGARWPLLAAAFGVPVLALLLYLGSGSQPDMPSVDGAGAVARARQEAALLQDLRQRLAALPADNDRTRQGYVLLGSVEEAHGRDAEAAAAFRLALRGRFDPAIAARAAEAAVRAEGGVSEASAALFRRALAEAPDAPWAEPVRQRLQEKRLP